MTVNQFKQELDSLLEKFNKENQCVIEKIDLSLVNLNNIGERGNVYYHVELVIKSN